VVSLSRAVELFVDSEAGCTVVILDQAATVTAWGRAAARLTGHDAGEVVGRPFSYIWAEAGNVEVLLQRAVSCGEAVGEIWPSGSDRSRRWVTGRITALRDDDRELIGFVVVIIDARPARDASAKDDRISTAVLDKVVHPIFAAGLELDSLSSVATDPEVRRRVVATVEHLDEALRNLRGAITDFSPPSDRR
jgi:PAS domain S-box-containing protein